MNEKIIKTREELADVLTSELLERLERRRLELRNKILPIIRKHGMPSADDIKEAFVEIARTRTARAKLRKIRARTPTAPHEK